MNDPGYHAHHAPFGAGESFVLGMAGVRAGWSPWPGSPGRQDVFVGYRYGQEPWQLLPFFSGTGQSLAELFPDSAPDLTAPVEPTESLAEGKFGRSLGWATDRWFSGAFGVTLYSSFGETADPGVMVESEARYRLAPLQCVMLTYDNSLGIEPVRLMFGLGEAGIPFRPLGDTTPGLAGFAVGNRFGFAVKAGPDVSVRQAFNLFDRRNQGSEAIFRLGNQAAVIIDIPPGGRASVPLVIGFYDDSFVSSGLEGRRYYTRYFGNLESVLAHGLNHHSEYVAEAAERDADLDSGGLDENERFLLAQGTHSYLACTELLVCGGQPVWIVNEGEYRMINTLDLLADHVFFELAYHPWTVRRTLDLFADRYSYHDRIRMASGEEVDGGLSFTHDMGVAGQFSPARRSSYECAGRDACFAFMTQEELVNWVCVAACYAEKTGDESWLSHHTSTITACAESLLRRDHPEEAERSGVMSLDSVMCGKSGAEITTYDSLDSSLGRARNSVYLAVKTLAAWIMLERLAKRLELGDVAEAAWRQVGRLTETIPLAFDEARGGFRSGFEGGDTAFIIPVVEGLVFPLYLYGHDLVTGDARLKKLQDLMGRHLSAALVRGKCLEATNGGWRLSSSARNTWISKIAICQWVARELFPETVPAEELAAANAVHAGWIRGGGCGPYAMCDQIDCVDGSALGSRFYPRGVAAWLWLTKA